MRRFIGTALLICFVLGTLSVSVFAEPADKTKLEAIRGNALLGWTEIPKAVVAVTKDSDNPFLGITVGLLKGIANAFARTISGVGDIVTIHKTGETEGIKPSMVEIPDTTQSK